MNKEKRNGSKIGCNQGRIFVVAVPLLQLFADKQFLNLRVAILVGQEILNVSLKFNNI